MSGYTIFSKILLCYFRQHFNCIFKFQGLEHLAETSIVWPLFSKSVTKNVVDLP